MSHYFYNNIFDFVSNDGQFAYYIEQDYSNSSQNPAIYSDPNGADYVVQVHYLGDPATTFKIQTDNIDTSKIAVVDYVSKGINTNFIEGAPEGDFIYDAMDDVSGQPSWSGQQSALDPHFGVLEFHVPLESPVYDIDGNPVVDGNGDVREDGYLYMESTMYFDVVAQDPGLTTSLNNLLADTYTLTSFLTDVDAAITTLNNTGTIEISGQLGSVHDASDDVFSEYNSRTGSETLYINQAPDMLYFDNVSYYDLNGDTVFGSDPLTSQVSSSMYIPRVQVRIALPLLVKLLLLENLESKM